MFTKSQLQTIQKYLFFDVATHQLHHPLSLFVALHNALMQTEDEEIMELITACMDLIAQGVMADALEARGWSCLTVDGRPFWHHPS